MTTINPMKALYKRLSKAGLSQPFVKKTAFPGWWNDDIALTPAGYGQALSLISRNLRINIHFLLQEDAKLDCQNSLPFLNKTPQGVAADKIHWAQCLGERMAEVALQGAGAVHALPDSAAAMRTELCADNNPPDLEKVLDFCWNIGVPVLYLHEIPSGTSKPHAMIFRSGGRYVIVLSRKLKYSARAVFDALHEIGHAVLGHLSIDGALVNFDVSSDNIEHEANKFAAEVLSGDPDFKVTAETRINTATLVNNAYRLGKIHNIDPGVIAMNYSWNSENYPVAMAALKIVEPHADAVGIIRRYMRDRLDWEQISEESAEFLERMSGGKEE